MHTLDPQWTAVATGGSAVYPRPTQSTWRLAYGALRAPIWPLVLATACAAGLLLAFQEVVHSGVLQGEARNRATAAHSQALWQCDFLRGASQRASCHAQLSAVRQVDATLTSPSDTRSELVALGNR